MIGRANFRAIEIAFRARELTPGVRVQGFDPSEAVTTDTNGYFVLSGISGERATVRAWLDEHATDVASDVAVGTGSLVLRLPRLSWESVWPSKFRVGCII